jgi:hypothetical protein
VNPNDAADLRFKINVVSKTRRLLGDITFNLEPYKNVYDTYYVPLPLIDRDKEEKENEKANKKVNMPPGFR